MTLPTSRTDLTLKSEPSPRLLKLPQVLVLTRMNRSQWYFEVRAGTAPQPVKTGKRAVAWIENEVAQFLRLRIAERDRRLTKRADVSSRPPPEFPQQEIDDARHRKEAGRQAGGSG